MGVRKREMAEKMKEERTSTAFAKLNDCPSSPRKMRLFADIIRGKDVFQALNFLKFHKKNANLPREKWLQTDIC